MFYSAESTISVCSRHVGHGNFYLANKSRSKLVHDFNNFHQRHHSSGDGNFGLAYTHWDSVFGTVHE